MDFISPIIHFLTDGSKRLSTKAMLVISFILLILLLDNIFGFSFYYNNDKKINQIKELNFILRDSSVTGILREKVDKLRNDLIFHKSIKDQIYDFLNSSSAKSHTNDNSKNKNGSTKIDWWSFLSVNSFLIIAMIAIPFSAFSDKSDPLWKNLLILFFAEIIGFALCILMYKLASLIPVILQHVWINYLLNVLLNIGFVLLILYFQKKTESNG